MKITDKVMGHFFVSHTKCLLSQWARNQEFRRGPDPMDPPVYVCDSQYLILMINRILKRNFRSFITPEQMCQAIIQINK